MRECVRHHRDGVCPLAQVGINIGCILEIRSEVPVVEGVVVPSSGAGAHNRNGAVGSSMARHVGFLGQYWHLRNRVHIDRHRVTRLAAVLVGDEDHIVRGVRRRSRHRFRIDGGKTVGRSPFVRVRSHAAVDFGRQVHALTETDGSVALCDGHRQLFGQGDMNRYRIDIATKVGNRHHHILLRGGRRPCNGRLSRHSYLCSRRAVVGHTAQDGIGQIGNLKFAVGGNQNLRRNLFREIGTGGIGHQNRLLNRIGISTIVKNLISTGDVSTAIAICFIIRMGHTHIITTEVTIVDHQYILQADHIQSVGKLVFTGQQTVNRQRVKHARDGRTHRVAHHNRLREGHRCISAIIREGIDTLITPFAACAAIGRVAVRDLEQNVGATIRNFKIRKLQRSGSRIIAIHICIVNAEGIVKDGRHNGTGGILNHNDLRYHIGISASVKDLVGTGQLPATVVRRFIG